MKPKLFEFGYISRAHGMTGEIVIRTFDPNSTVVDEIDRIHARLKDGKEKDFTIEEVREGSKGDLLVFLKGITTRVTAEALIGSRLFAFREELPPPAEGEYFQGDLLGLTVKTPAGVVLGVIEEVMNAGPVPNFVIRKDGAELMVPFAEDFVKSIDLEKGEVILEPPEEA